MYPRRDPGYMRRVVLAATVCSTLMTTACTTLPSDSAPQALRSFEPRDERSDVATPKPGQEPDLLVRDFFKASANPSSNHAAARTFMTEQTAKKWKDSPEGNAHPMIVDRVDLNSTGVPLNGKVTYAVRGEVVGYLVEGGAYQPERAILEAEISLTKMGGEWRISELPDGVIIERVELNKQYEPHDIYFFDPKFRRLVADRRWIHTNPDTLSSALVSLLVSGPQTRLAPGVATAVPEGAAFLGIKDGAIEFAGLQTLSAEQRHRLQAQLAWTLSRSDVAEPYVITSDGVPLDTDSPELRLPDVAEFNPSASSTAPAPLYAVSGGELYEIESNTPTVVSAQRDALGKLRSADVHSSSGMVAMVYSTGSEADSEGSSADVDESKEKDSTLYYGAYDAPLRKVFDARRIGRPTIEPEGNAIWTVVDGTTVVRSARSTSTGEIANTEVDTMALWRAIGGESESQKPPIGVFRLAPSGVEAACIVEGKVYLATVAPGRPGEYRLENVQEIAGALSGQAVTLDWTADGSLLVGSTNEDIPLWLVAPDGSEVRSLPAANVTAPVRAVAADKSYYYVADQLSVVQLPVEGNATIWREVPALQGTRATPVVAR